jgi:hypothetical protein
MPGLRRDILFFHMPKAAGSSFNRLLARVTGREPVMFRESGTTELEAVLADPAPRVFSAHPMGQFALWKRVMDARSGAMKVVFLRDPVERYLSDYDFNRVHLDPLGVGLEDTLEGDVRVHLLVDNLQVKVAASLGSPRDYTAPATQADLERAKYNLLKGLDFVGLVECFEAACDMCLRQAGLEAAGEVPRVNARPRRKGRDDLAPDILQKVELKNLLDLDLYHFAASLFGQRLERTAADGF